VAGYAAFCWGSVKLSFWPELTTGAALLAKTKLPRPPEKRFDIYGILELRGETDKLQIERNRHARNDRKPCPS
jgi:hypothetical protein